MKYEHRTLVWIMSAAVAATGACVRDAEAFSDTLHPPALVLQQLDALKRVERVANLPAPIREGAFRGRTFAPRLGYRRTWCGLDRNGRGDRSKAAGPASVLCRVYR